MLHRQIVTTTSGEQRISHLLIRQEAAADRLMIMLPGRGYLNEHPVMYYLRRVGLQNGYDVLSITYGFQAQLYSEAGIQGDLLDEIRQAVDAALTEHTYKQIIIAGKSLGTPLAALYGAELAARFPEVRLSHILLTPVQNATAAVSERRTLAVIGTADAAYDADLIASDQDHPWIEWLVLDGVNHSLEYADDWQQSLTVLETVMVACERFLRI